MKKTLAVLFYILKIVLSYIGFIPTLWFSILFFNLPAIFAYALTCLTLVIWFASGVIAVKHTSEFKFKWFLFYLFGFDKIFDPGRCHIDD